MRYWTAAIGLALVVSSCAAQEVMHVSSPGARLTRHSPATQLVLGAPPSASAIVALSIGRVHNPEREPVNLELALSQPTSAQPAITVGAVSLFPNDQPARFLVRATKQLQTLGQRASAYLLKVTLLPNSDRQQASQLRLEEITADWSALE
jgi:hypothetical protein